jgi:hypothetical protein
MKKKFSAILATGLFLVCMFGVVTLPAAAFADHDQYYYCGTIIDGMCVINYSWSYISIYDTTNLAASQQVNTYSTQIIGRMKGGSTLYNQTFMWPMQTRRFRRLL